MSRITRRQVSLLGLGLLSGFTLYTSPTAQAKATHNADPVQLLVSGLTATISNGIYTIKFNSNGTGYSLVWQGKEIIGPAKGFYSSINGGTGFTPTQLQVTTNTPEIVDIAYISSWGALHYVVRSGVSGLYSYFIADSIGTVSEYRTLYRVDGSIFRNGYNAERTGTFPTLSDILQAQVLQNETFKLLDGQVYTKYDYSTYMAADHVHGVFGTDGTNNYGVWMIPASHEYYNGGPMKQELMVHVESATGDGVVLNMLSASHFGNPDVDIPSGKIYGPWLVYFNNGNIPDAREQAHKEEEKWPYEWLSDPHYPLERTTVSGILHLADGRPAAKAMVTLALPGGDIYPQGGDYIFYSQADADGRFRIPYVRPGTYSLYAYATGNERISDVTDQYELDNIVVSGKSLDLGKLIWSPPTYGKLLWQIGTADRKATEFKLGNLPRQYGLFNETPVNLTYTIGQSKPATDWYYAQTVAGIWTISFNLDEAYSGTGHLTIALAGLSKTDATTVSVNGTAIGNFPAYANDAAIYRSTNQSGYYHLLPLTFPASLLQVGTNTVTFQATNVSFGGGAMYDTIKLEVG